MNSWRVSPQEAGLRLAKFLHIHLNDSLSVRAIGRAIESNACKIDGQLETFPSYKVRQGQRITFNAQVGNPKQTVAVLWEDQDFIVFDKPADYISRAVADYLLVHRLDRYTTGAWLLAKNERAQKAAEELFRKRQVEKEYLALVAGVPRESEGMERSFLYRAESREGLTRWASGPKGKEALTHWRVEQRGKTSSLLRCFPITGRTHQIRVQLSERGLPLLGDHRYCRRFSSPHLPSHYLLHAEKLAFSHPLTGEELEFSSKLPETFSHFIDSLP